MLTDTTPGGKNDRLRISYDDASGKITIEDQDGNPIFWQNGVHSRFEIAATDFTGDLLINVGAGDDQLTVDPSFFDAGKRVHFDGGAGTNQANVALEVNPSTVDSDLQQLVSWVRDSGMISAANSALQITVAADTSNLPSVAAAVQSLAPTANGSQAEIVVQLSGSGYSSQSLVAPAGIKLIISGNAVFSIGTAPGLSIQSGDVRLVGATLASNIDAATVLVSGGSLVIRDSTIEETSAGDRAAIEIAAGSADLGTASSLGRNVLRTNGAGSLLRNTTTSPVPALGNTFQSDGAPLPDGFAIEDRVYHGVDAAGLGVVYWVDKTIYATTTNSNIQRAIDASAANDVVNVQTGLSQEYNVGDKLLTVAFQNASVVSQQLDEVNPGQRKLTVTGTSGNDNISFKQNGAVVNAVISGVASGSFMPTSRLVAFGLGGDDSIDASNNDKLSCWFHGGDGNDALKGGKANDVLLGGAGNDNLNGWGGSDLLISGTGSDLVSGGNGQEIIVSGTTTFDSNDIALLHILNEWSSDRAYSARVANIMGTGTGDSFAARLNGNYFLNADVARGFVTVIDDNAQDTLNGGNGVDLYFANLVLDGSNGDQATTTDLIISLNKNEQAIDTDVPPPPPDEPPV